jgi:NADPH:quinone reductase
MRRVVCLEIGPPDELVVEDGPALIPAPHQVVVDVEAAGVNFVDALLVQGKYQIKPPTPFSPGSEVAGVVSAVGDDVGSAVGDDVGSAAAAADTATGTRTGTEGTADGRRTVTVGDRVIAACGLGGYAEQVAVPAASVVPIPESLSSTRAAAMLQSYATALYAFGRIVHQRGETVLVLGAGGGVGLAAIDVATARGLRAIGAASSFDKRAAAEAAGAVASIDYTAEDLKLRARELSGGGADIVVDPVGGAHAEPALRALRGGGRYLVVGFASGEIPRLPANQILLNNRTVVGIDWGAWTFQHPDDNRALIAHLMEMVADGLLHPPEPMTYPLGKAAEALGDLIERRAVGKSVLVP